MINMSPDTNREINGEKSEWYEELDLHHGVHEYQDEENGRVGIIVVIQPDPEIEQEIHWIPKDNLTAWDQFPFENNLNFLHKCIKQSDFNRNDVDYFLEMLKTVACVE